MTEGGCKQSRPTDDGGAPARVLRVRGMSGARRSTALKILEDMGYEALDNLRLSLVPTVIEGSAAGAPAMAVGADLRARGFAIDSMLETLDEVVGRTARDLKVLFIDCDDERLQRRYTETRRPHPLCRDRPIMDGVRLERRLVSSLRDRADLVIDTSNLTAAQLKRLLTGQFARELGGIRAFITSFTYRHGIPRAADLIFDVHFLDNPHYRPEPRPLTGRDPAVRRDIEADPGFAPFFIGLRRWLEPLLPRREKEGKSHLTIAIGCTGGRHRSVYAGVRLAKQLRAAGARTALSRRDFLPFGPPGPVPLGALMAAS